MSGRCREAAAARAPANKFSAEDRERILDVCNAPAYLSLPPSLIVLRLADEGEYLASESSFYRVLREDSQKTCLAEGIREAGLVLHSDNGGPMKGATILATS